MGLQEKIREIEEEMRRTQVNKATEFHLGILKARLAKLKRELISPHRLMAGKGGGGFDVKRSGDSTVAIIGLPSVGKSTLLSKITNAESKAAAYAFTTLKCIPGMLEYNKAKIQLLDLPGIIEGARDGRGRGREVIGVARTADLILIVLDAVNPINEYNIITQELHGFGIRINSRPPDIVLRKTSKGGIIINSTVRLTKISQREIVAVLNEYNIYNADVVLRSDATIDDFIDTVEGNRVYIPAVITINKMDLIGWKMEKKMPFEYIPISAENGLNIEILKKAIYDKLAFMNIYTKRKGERADLGEPLIMRQGSTVSDVCERLHRDLKKEFRYALVWGKSVKHQPQRVGLEHILADGDILYIAKK